MNKYISAILNTRGWKEINDLFLSTIRDCKDAGRINGDLDNETLAREIRASVMAGERLEELLRKILLSKTPDKKDKISYK